MYCFENILLDIIYTFHHAFTLYQSFGLGEYTLSCLDIRCDTLPETLQVRVGDITLKTAGSSVTTSVRPYLEHSRVGH